MSWISATDPLALLALSSGQITSPTTGGAASGSSSLDSKQRSAVLGEPVPVVFARWRNNAGGILISPPATEARFSNDATNAVTASYLLVLTEGQMDSIQVRDVFQGPCRVGTHSQTYNRRAGTWTPGNFITQQGAYPLPQCPYYCGSVGAYPGISTLSFTVTVGNGNDFWAKQVHGFVRGGMWVSRLEDGALGPSDSYADLVLWLMQQTSRIPAALIDTTALGAADAFLRANGFTCNCALTTSQNLSDLLSSWSRYFLLSESSSQGKRGLRPLLPVNNDGTIKTTAITPSYLFDESLILPGSFEISYINLADRLPFVVQLLWRQQLENDFGIIRTAEVRYNGTADNGPYEQHDLSAFCTSEAHAVKVGAYILARRYFVSHTCRFAVAPEAHSALVKPGDIVQVQLLRTASAFDSSVHSQFYQVERISKDITGEVTYECTHFPVNADQQSLIALAVTTVQPSGILLTSNQSGVSCDLNSKTDTTVPAETFRSADKSVSTGQTTMEQGEPGNQGSYEVGGQQLIELPLGGGSDGLDGFGLGGYATGSTYPAGDAKEGSVLYAPDPCPNNQTSQVKWFARNDSSWVEFNNNLSQKGATILNTGEFMLQVGSKKVFDVISVWYCGNNQGEPLPPGTSPAYHQHTYRWRVSGSLADPDAERVEYNVFLTRKYPPFGLEVISWYSPGRLVFSGNQEDGIPLGHWYNGGGGSWPNDGVGEDVIRMDVLAMYQVKNGVRTRVIDYTGTPWVPHG